MSLPIMIDDQVLALGSTLEEVKRLNKATQQSLDALLERLGPAPALNLQVPIPLRYTPTIPASAGRKKSSLKPSLPSDFDGDRSAGKAFLTSCQTYIRLRSEAFDNDFVKIVWAISYMEIGHASRWATWEFETEVRNRRFRFLDWLDFEEEFWKDFLPLNAEAAAINTLETTDYFQDSRPVDAYLDQFRDLISDSGYSDPKKVVVKFRRGLDHRILMALAAMPSGRPSNSDPEAWFRLTVQLDQNQAADEAFYGQVPTLVFPLSPTAPSTPLPALPEVNPCFDACQMSSDELRKMLEGILVIRHSSEDK